MSCRRWIGFAALPGLAAIAIFSPLLHADDPPTLFAQQRRQYREEVIQYPLIKPQKISEVFRLRLDGSQLALDPILEPDHDYTQRRAELSSFSEPATVLCWYLSQDLGQVQFEFNVDDYSGPTAFGRLHVLARPNTDETTKDLKHIEIRKTWQSRTGFRQIYFSQVNTNVHLVQAVDDNDPQSPPSIDIGAKDFASLRREHPSETDMLLRPILHELHQESALAADPEIAWQVFLREWPSDPRLQPRINAQLRGLDSDDFHVRRKAAAALQQLGREGATLILKMDRGALSLEQNALLDDIVARFKPVSDAAAARLADDPNFLLDCLYGDDVTARILALARLKKVTGQAIDIDLNGPPELRVDQIGEVRRHLAPTPASLRR